MANIADIIVKKSDGTTSITYTAITGSAGDKSPAIWRSETSAQKRSNRDVISFVANDNGPKTARRMTAKAVMPVAHFADDANLETAADRVVGDVSIVVPKALLDSQINEKIDQFLNVLGSAEFRAAFKAGISPN